MRWKKIKQLKQGCGDLLIEVEQAVATAANSLGAEAASDASLTRKPSARRLSARLRRVTGLSSTRRMRGASAISRHRGPSAIQGVAILDHGGSDDSA